VETNQVGYCCRDPFYEDPWPGGMMMPNMAKPPPPPPVAPSIIESPAQTIPVVQCPDRQECVPQATCASRFGAVNMKSVPVSRLFVKQLQHLTIVCVNSLVATQLETPEFAATEHLLRRLRHRPLRLLTTHRLVHHLLADPSKIICLLLHLPSRLLFRQLRHHHLHHPLRLRRRTCRLPCHPKSP
jgi:Clip-domain serine protease homolog Scarface